MEKYSIGDVELAYQVVGQGDSIVFIHGLGSSARDWEYQVDFFSKAYKVVTFDVRGHGESDKPAGPYSLPMFARDTTRLMEGLGLDSAHIVGISMGGMIGLQLALDHPQRVRSLVVVNAGPEMIVRTFKQRWQVWQRFVLVRLFGMRKVGEVLGARMFPKEEQAALRDLFVARWAENDSRAWQEALKALVGWSVRNRLGEINCPVLVVSADQDYTPVETKAAYVSELQHGKLVVIENSRHATPVDQPEPFNQTLLGFLQAL